MAATTAPRGALEGPLIPSPRIAAGLLGCAAIALAVRSLGLETVFPSEGVVLLSLSDAHFYARLALFAFVNFPEPLTFDRFIAWPDGAVVPAPPGFGLAIAGMARLFGDSVSTFERVAAWVSPFAGALTTLPVYAIGRRVASPGTGLGAAALFAVLPASTSTSSIGNVDHHATVALLGACWIASSISQVRPATAGRLALRALRHAALVAALLFTWSGSLLYLALGEGARLAAWAATGRGPRPLVAQAAAALVASAAVVPWIAAAPVPLDGPLATTTLSWFHVGALTAIAGTCGALALIEAWRPTSGLFERVAFSAAIGFGILGLALALPGVRDGLAPGLGFLTMADEWAARNPEQFPLFGTSPLPGFGPSPLERFGLFVFLVPVAPLLVALRWKRAPDRAPRWILGIWLLGLLALSLSQVRYAHDFAASACVAFALALAALRGEILQRTRLAPGTASALVVCLAALLIAPAVIGVHLPRVPTALRHLAGSGPPGRFLSPRESLMRFAEAVRRETPETAGFLDAKGRPEYGLLVPAALGHSFLYEARRPVPANNLGPYLDAEKYRAVDAFYGLTSEEEVLATVDALRVRYVVTPAAEGTPAGSLHDRLHRSDGSATDGAEHWQHFRLVIEGPPRGRPVKLLYPGPPPRRLITYKLFERVAGAVLEVRAAPGSPVRAALPLRTPLGRRFRFVARGRAGPDGIARLRVPYPTEGVGPTRAESPWEVTLGDQRVQVDVSEQEVREGLTVVVPAPIPRAPRRAEP